jgi:hypothetical protein
MIYIYILLCTLFILKGLIIMHIKRRGFCTKSGKAILVAGCGGP